MIGRLRQLSEPRLRQQAGIEESQTPVERDILVKWVRYFEISVFEVIKSSLCFICRLASSYSDSGMESSDNELSHSYDILPDMDFGRTLFFRFKS